MSFGSGTLSGFSGAASDLFAAVGHKARAQYDYAEGKAYGLAAHLAFQNEDFTKTSTAIKESQQQREAMLMMRGQ
jgi:hypothetical protein